VQGYTELFDLSTMAKKIEGKEVIIKMKSVPHSDIDEICTNFKKSFLKSRPGVEKKLTGKKPESEIMTDTLKSFGMTLLFIYLTALGFTLTEFTKTGYWDWNYFIYATIFDIVPLSKSWTQGQSNLKIFREKDQKHDNELKYLQMLKEKEDEMTTIKIQKGITDYELKLMRDKEKSFE
jgi:hypothetical protein